MKKRCSKCGQEKPLEEFARNKSMQDDRQHYCKSCRSEYIGRRYRTGPAVRQNAESWKARNPETWRSIVLCHHAKKRVITPEQYEALAKEQGGVCAVCRQPQRPEGRMLYADHDHDHETGEVRGLLCTTCNLALGYFQDDPERCMQAARYLLELEREFQKYA